MFKPQKGFTALEVVLLIALVAIIGFAGWTWYQSTQANNNQTEVSEEDSSEPQPENAPEEEEEAEQLAIANECNDRLFEDKSEADTWTRNLQNGGASGGQVGIYSVTQLCELSNGYKTLTFKQDRTVTNDGIPPAIAIFDTVNELENYNSLECRALGGEGAHLFVTSVNDENITAECRSGHMGQSSVQTFEIDRETLKAEMINDQYEE